MFISLITTSAAKRILKTIVNNNTTIVWEMRKKL